MEVGKYIDFHTYTPSTLMDYATRIICDSAPGNIVSLPSSDGTLALTTDNVASATKATQDGNGNVITSTYLPLSGGTLTGPLKWTRIHYPLPLHYTYILGVDDFGSGGTTRWCDAK
jgi:hypothetical protein